MTTACGETSERVAAAMHAAVAALYLVMFGWHALSVARHLARDVREK